MKRCSVNVAFSPKEGYEKPLSSLWLRAKRALISNAVASDALRDFSSSRFDLLWLFGCWTEPGICLTCGRSLGYQSQPIRTHANPSAGPFHQPGPSISPFHLQSHLPDLSNLYGWVNFPFISYSIFQQLNPTADFITHQPSLKSLWPGWYQDHDICVPSAFLQCEHKSNRKRKPFMNTRASVLKTYNFQFKLPRHFF